MLPLISHLLEDKELPHYEESLNIINLLIFKRVGPLPEQFNQFFGIFAYSILGLPQELGSLNLPENYKKILVNICLEPDEDIVANVIGLFRNYIARFGKDLHNYKNEVGVSYMESLFKIVEAVKKVHSRK